MSCPHCSSALLVGCGGDDSSSGDSAGADKGGAANSPEVKKLIRQTFGPNDKAKSGNISAIVDITVKGHPRYREPIQVSLVGPFSDAAGQPEAKLDVLLGLRGGILGGDMYLKGDTAYVGLGSTAYEIRRRSRRRLRPAEQGRQHARPDPGRVQHQPRPLGEEPAHRRN